jgi:GNAT superfamily N-acetyltransferase
MAKDISIRFATMDDAPIIIRHRRAMWVDMGTGTQESLDAMDATFAPYLQRVLADGSYHGWLAHTADGHIIGSGGLLVHEWLASPRDRNPRPRRAYILNMYTEPPYRGRGVARRIMSAILDWCRADGFETVFLHASEQGRPLYESLGFEPTTEMRLRL